MHTFSFRLINTKEIIVLYMRNKLSCRKSCSLYQAITFFSIFNSWLIVYNNIILVHDNFVLLKKDFMLVQLCSKSVNHCENLRNEVTKEWSLFDFSGWYIYSKLVILKVFFCVAQLKYFADIFLWCLWILKKLTPSGLVHKIHPHKKRYFWPPSHCPK